MNLKKRIYFSITFIVLFLNTLLFSQIRVGYGLNSDYEMTILGINIPAEIKGGITLGYDYSLQNQDKTDLGVGGEFMLKREGVEGDVGNIAFNSIYGYGKYLLNEELYAYGRLGYNFHTTGGDDAPKAKGGITFGFGGGYIVNEKIALHGIYSSHAGSLTTTGSPLSFDAKYTNLNIGIVYSI